MPNDTPQSDLTLTPHPKPQDVPTPKRRSWGDIRRRANTTARIAILFLGLLVAGGVIGYYFQAAKQPASTPKTPRVTGLTTEELSQLGQIGSNLGSTGQVLNIASDSLFRGKVSVASDLSIGGQLNANGPVTLSSLNITGNTAATGLNVGSNLVVGGTTTLQRGLTVSGLASVTNLNVSGSASLNALNASSIAVRNLSISGPLTVAHLISSGPTPSIVGGTTGAGGTVSISGNDTAGTVNINTGSGPGNLLATVTFRAAFGATVHVQLTPLTDGAAAAGAYVTRTSAGFQIHARTPPAGATLSFDYLVMQ
jgi:hypothetical protein